MEYVKSILSKEFKTYFRALEKSLDSFKRGNISPQLHTTHKRNLYPKLRELLIVCRLIMSIQDFETYIMPYQKVCKFEKELKNFKYIEYVNEK